MGNTIERIFTLNDDTEPRRPCIAWLHWGSATVSYVTPAPRGCHTAAYRRVGDFAAAVLTAHEFGHHIQDELSARRGVPAPANPNKELIADCFAGVWAYSAFLDNYLEPGDIQVAIDAVAVIGDNVGSHGTGEQRDNAFLIGFTGSKANPQGGLPANCMTAYWPEWLALNN